MNTKLTKTILLLTLLVLLVGITSATTASDNTTTKIVKEKSETQKTEVQKSSNEIIKEKTITKDGNKRKKVKKDSPMMNITNYNQLRSYLTSDKNDTLYLNITENIQLTDNIQINKAIKTLTITSPFIEINGNNNYQFLRITENNKVFINNTIITKCKGEYGGALYNEGSLLINNSILSNNIATYGGNIYNNGELTIIMSKIDYNSAKYGGAIYNNGATTIINSNLNNNKATEEGGSIYNAKGKLNITDNKIENNVAKNGGAIYGQKGTLHINNTQINHNTATNEGGAIYNNIAKLTITENKIENNTATNGGAIYGQKGTLHINNTQINHNTATNEGGAIYNNKTTTNITNNTISHNKATNGGAITTENGTITTYNNNITNNKATKNGGAIYNNIAKLTIYDNKINNNTANEGGAIKNHHGNNVTILNNKFINNSANSASAISSGDYKDGQYYGNNIIIDENFFILNHATKTPSKSAIQSAGENNPIEFNDMMQPSNYNSVNIIAKNAKITNNTFTDSNVILKLKPVNSKIGERILLKAEVIDGYENKTINGGNLVFKLNGKSLRSDGRFDSNASAMKFSVKNGVVSQVIVADLYLRNAKNLTASYSGTYKYDEVTSSSIEAQILKRNPQINVTVTPLWTKHYDTLTITAKVWDITKNSTNNTIITDNTKIMIKINGRTLKDAKGNVLYVPIDKNSLATYNYTVPAGMGAITANKTTRNYSVTAIFVGDNYYPDVRDSTYFHVVRSTTNVKISKVTVNRSNVLSVKATLKDYKGNNLIGSNKVIVKINGKSYRYNDGKSAYWLVQNGVVSISGIEVNPKTTIKRVQLVTGERQAYLEGRAETTNIIRV